MAVAAIKDHRAARELRKYIIEDRSVYVCVGISKKGKKRRKSTDNDRTSAEASKEGGEQFSCQ
jgi:hypothetical protein